MSTSSSLIDGLRKNGAKLAALAALLLIASAVGVVIFRAPPGGLTTDEGPVRLERLPAPEGESLYIVVDARAGEFPVDAVRLLVDGVTVSPVGNSPASAVLPILGAAGDSALVVAEREKGFYMYGALALRSSESEELSAGRVPKAWQDSLVGAEMLSTDVGSAYQINALNISSPLYIEVGEDDCAYISDSLFDIERIREVRAGRLPGMAFDWPDLDEWGGRLLVSDGGISKMLISGSEERGAENAVVAKISWVTTSRDTHTLSEASPVGVARWSLTGAEHLVGKSFAASLKQHDWSPHGLFIPEPLIAAVGVNMPDPGKNTHELPPPFGALVRQLERMRLKPAEIRNILTGPFSLSLGGRTQVLWFDLPGLVLDMPGRGATGETLIDRFWAETFLGASPKPVTGYEHGGTTDLPFTVMAAANADTTVIGLTAPDVERSAEMRRLLSDETSAIGWFFVDIPRLGAALSDMPTFSAILNDEEGLPLEEDVASLLRDSMSRLGRLFVSLEAVGSGKALWYH